MESAERVPTAESVRSAQHGGRVDGWPGWTGGLGFGVGMKGAAATSLA